MEFQQIDKSKINRDQAIDCVKGCLILMVLITHIKQSALSPIISQTNINYLMPWKMGLFFIISGLLYKHNPSFTNFAKWKFNRIIRPTLILAAAAVVLNPNSTGGSFTRFLWEYSFGVVKSSLVPTWFTLSLFITLITFNILISLGKNRKAPVAFLCLSLTALAYYFSPHGFENGDTWKSVGFQNEILTLPFRLSTLYITLPLVLVGFLIQKAEFYKSPFVAALCLPIFLWSMAYLGVRTDMHSNYYSNYIYGTLCAIISLPVMYQIGNILRKSKHLNEFLAIISKEAIFILVLHSVSFSLMQDLLSISGKENLNSERTTIVFISGLLIPIILAYFVNSSSALKSILFGDSVKGKSIKATLSST